MKSDISIKPEESVHNKTAIASDADIITDIKVKNILRKIEVISSVSLFVGILVIISLSALHEQFQNQITHNLISLFSGIVIWGINAVSIAFAFNKINKLLLERYIHRAIESVINDLGINTNKIETNKGE